MAVIAHRSNICGTSISHAGIVVPARVPVFGECDEAAVKALVKIWDMVPVVG